MTAIEFALLAPVFILFLCGTTELSLLFVTQHVIENAVFNASRTAKTGYVAASKTQLETVQDVLYDRLGSLYPLVDKTKATITYTSYATLSDMTTNTNATAASLGTSAQIMVYTVTYPWKFFTPLISSAMGYPSGTMDLTARIVVRNEPY